MIGILLVILVSGVYSNSNETLQEEVMDNLKPDESLNAYLKGAPIYDDLNQIPDDYKDFESYLETIRDLESYIDGMKELSGFYDGQWEMTEGGLEMLSEDFERRQYTSGKVEFAL